MAMRFMKHRLKDYVRVLAWRWIKNAGAAVAYLGARESLSVESEGILQALKSDGIAISSTLADPRLMAELTSEAQRLFQECWDPVAQRPVLKTADYKGDRSGMDDVEQKQFMVSLTPKILAVNSVFVRYALQPAFLELANAYLGQRARLRAVQLWLNYATHGEPTSTQLFHRDGDDVMNLKMFTYLSDVDESNGPFTFIPGTQPLGHRPIKPVETKYHRVTDDMMELGVPRSQWMVCTGKAGDVIVADTCGYHKGLKPAQGYRLMLMVHYASRAAITGTDLLIQGPVRGGLSRAQVAALT